MALKREMYQRCTPTPRQINSRDKLTTSCQNTLMTELSKNILDLKFTAQALNQKYQAYESIRSQFKNLIKSFTKLSKQYNLQLNTIANESYFLLSIKSKPYVFCLVGTEILIRIEMLCCETLHVSKAGQRITRHTQIQILIKLN